MEQERNTRSRRRCSRSRIEGAGEDEAGAEYQEQEEMKKERNNRSRRRWSRSGIAGEGAGGDGAGAV
jgi:hypothetical protein